MTAWLPSVLRAAGLDVTVYDEKPRPGDYSPRATLNHHTAAKASAPRPSPALGIVRAGRPDLPGPLCQLLIGWDGHCHVITTGRANHAGKARESGPMPAGDGNELYIGIEIDYSGYVAPSPAQYAATVTANAAILTRLGKSAAYARGHRETSTTGKWDPGKVDLDLLRADIATAMTTKEDPMPSVSEIASTVWSATVGSGARRRSLAQVLLSAESEAKAARAEVAVLREAVQGLSGVDGDVLAEKVAAAVNRLDAEAVADSLEFHVTVKES